MSRTSLKAANLLARVEVIGYISKSLKYFKDQLSKYASLEMFVKDSVQPFSDTLSRTFCTLEKLTDRLQKIELYYIYSRKLNEITLVEAIGKFKDINQSASSVCDVSNLDSLQSVSKMF